MRIVLPVWGLTLCSLQTGARGPPGLRALHACLLCLPLAGIWFAGGPGQKQEERVTPMTPLRRTGHAFPKALLRDFKKKENKSTKGYMAQFMNSNYRQECKLHEDRHFC